MFRLILILIASLIFIMFTESVSAYGINVPANSQLNLNTATLYVSGDVTNEGTLQLSTGTIALTGNWTNSGIFASGTETINFTAASGIQTVTCGGITDNEDFYNITHSGGGMLQLQDALVVKNNFINSSGTWDANGQDMTIYGDFSNSSIFTHNNNTVYFCGISQSDIMGTTTFYNLSIDTNAYGAKTIRFEAGVEQTVTNCLTLIGYAEKILTIHSTKGGTQAYLTLSDSGSQLMDHLDVHDNSAENGQTLAAGPYSTLTNTINWTSKIISVVLRDAGDTNDYSEWTLGSEKDLDTVYIMDGNEYVLIKNNGNVAEDFSISATSTYWTLAASTGQDQCIVMGLFNGNSIPVAGDFVTANDVISGTSVWATEDTGNGKFEGTNDGDNVSADTGKKLYIYFKTPSSLTRGDQESITVTIGAREH